MAAPEPVGANPVQYTITDPSGIYTCETNVVVTETPYWGADPDGDGFAQLTAQNIIQTCVPPPGYVNQFGDDCPFDPLKLSPGTCGCGNVDHPNFEPCGDGNVCNGAEIWFDCECIAGTPLNCDDGNPCTLDSCDPLIGCVHTPAPDADGDGVCDALDNCPTSPGQIGSACSDNNPCTTNDVLNANCQCAGSPVPDGTLCDLNAQCIAGACTPISTDTDGDGIPDDTDSCPTVPGQIGSVCTDNNPLTLGDALNTACVCQGYPGTQVTMHLYTDGNGAQISWKLFNSYTGALVFHGTGYGNNTNYGITITVPQTCLELRVYDSGGNGFNPGGYRLEDASGRRLVDNMDNGFTITDSTSTVFCLPISDNKLINAHVDGEDWLTTNTIIASADAAVSAQWGIGDQTDDGYQFWFTDPNGGYSRKITRTHATSSGQGPANAVRACKLPLSAIVSNPLPFDRLLNVRIRSRVNGLFGEFGQASRFRILAAPSNCPLTQLNDIVGDPNLSCGATKTVGASGQQGKVFAKVVLRNGQPATHYRFEIALPSESYLRNCVSTNAALLLSTWVTAPLLCGTNGYTVRVQASFDGGLTYCPFGTSCPLVVTNTTNSCTSLANANTCGNGVIDAGEACDDGNLVNGDGCDANCMFTVPEVQHRMSSTELEGSRIYPNPVHDGHLYIRLSGLSTHVTEASVEVFDIYGKRISANTFATNEAGTISSMLQLPLNISPGVYVVNISAGDVHLAERLMVE
ncbi:MAG: T9SS type A sorting domain-containing protein [Flavobacteriales bacterium]|nr:T9SS type A sorting domain-containing protein [Flavobacteriales bacterium]